MLPVITIERADDTQKIYRIETKGFRDRDRVAGLDRAKVESRHPAAVGQTSGTQDPERFPDGVQVGRKFRPLLQGGRNVAVVGEVFKEVELVAKRQIPFNRRF